eukprot:GHVT01070477.1.p1 GENE.GHVT01070477.1~~GHVT01070477.1.p1  ORF type:complete len:222 (-),score=53.33 GHVT01070477.1:111-776(-)
MEELLPVGFALSPLSDPPKPLGAAAPRLSERENLNAFVVGTRARLHLAEDEPKVVASSSPAAPRASDSLPPPSSSLSSSPVLQQIKRLAQHAAATQQKAASAVVHRHAAADTVPKPKEDDGVPTGLSDGVELHTICTQLLMEASVQSFVDFFLVAVKGRQGRARAGRSEDYGGGLHPDDDDDHNDDEDDNDSNGHVHAMSNNDPYSQLKELTLFKPTTTKT